MGSVLYNDFYKMERAKFEIEICSNSVQSTIAAMRGGADRVELCDNLYEGGTTPSLGTFLQAKEQTDIAIFPIIRPRGGDFLYSDDEFKVMKQDIRLFREYGVDGVVIGCLNANGTVDYERCARLIDEAKGLPITFHRAFDMTREPFEALETIQKLGVSRLLTSGQQNKAVDGVKLLADLVEKSGKTLRIMVGSGVSEENIGILAQQTGASAFHMSLRTKEESKMQYRKSGVFMGGLPEIPEYTNAFSDVKRIQTIIETLKTV